MLKKPIPNFIKNLYYRLYIITHTGTQVTCPICKLSLKRFIVISKIRATPSGNLCPRCFSLERHRLLWLFLVQNSFFGSPQNNTIFHVAPEPCFTKFFIRQKNNSYIISNFNSPNKKHHIDITSTSLQDQSIDLILCNHVLEHIINDHKALLELFRILKATGRAILNAPIDYSKETTYEDFTITLKKDRAHHFGQEDHVRIYGRDYSKRLEYAGFKVEEIDYGKQLGEKKRLYYGLLDDDLIYLCSKISS